MPKISKLTILIFVSSAATIIINFFNLPCKELLTSVLAILMAAITLLKDHEAAKDAKKLNDDISDIKALSATNAQNALDGLSVLPDDVSVSLTIILSPVPVELIRRFVVNNNHVAPNQYNYENGFFDYEGEPFYQIPKLMLWVEFLDRNNRENVIYSSIEPIPFRQRIDVLSPRINFSYFRSGEHPAQVMILVSDLNLTMNHHGRRTLWKDISNSILRIIIGNGNDDVHFPDFRKQLAYFTMADRSGYININISNFEEIDNGVTFEADLGLR